MRYIKDSIVLSHLSSITKEAKMSSKYEEMIKDRIDYTETAQLLGVSMATISQAVTRGVLTPLPRRGGRAKGYFVRRQVELFATPNTWGEKKHVGLTHLSNDEIAEWHSIKREIDKLYEAQSIRSKKPVQKPDVAIEDSVDIAIELMERVTMLFLDVMTELSEAHIEQFNPDTLLAFIKKSNSFQQILKVLHIEEMMLLSDETLQKLNNAAYNTAQKFVTGLMQLMLKNAATNKGFSSPMGFILPSNPQTESTDKIPA